MSDEPTDEPTWGWEVPYVDLDDEDLRPRATHLRLNAQRRIRRAKQP